MINEFKLIFSTDEMIKVLEQNGFVVKKESVEICNDGYQDKSYCTTENVYIVYLNGKKYFKENYFNMHHNMNSQIFELFNKITKEKFLKLLYEK